MKKLSARFLIVMLALRAFAAAGQTSTAIEVSSSPSPAYYRAGQTVPVTLTFPESVTVTGTPLLALNDGGTARYASGSGGAILTFHYTVSAGDTSALLDYSSTSALTLNGGSIDSAPGAGANLALIPPDRPGSLSADATVVIDTTAPTISISAPSTTSTVTGASVSYTVTYADANFASATLSAANVTLANSGVTGTISVTAVNSTTFTVTVSSLVGPGTQAIKIAAGTATDLAGNTAPAAGPSASFSVTGPVTHFSVSAPATATAGVAFNATVTALDALGNTITSYAGTVHFTSSDPMAVLPANAALKGGVRTLSFTLQTAGSQTVTATDTTTSSITGTSGNVTVSPAAATHLAVSLPASATAGAQFSGTVTALDAFNNKATAYTGTVHFTGTDPSSVLPANSTLTAGVGTFSFTLKTAGSQTVTATDTTTSSITGTSGNVTVSSAAATHFTVTLPGSATVGAQFNGTVTALDAFNNTATAYAGTVHFTSSDGSAVLPANSKLTAGVGTFSFTFKTTGNQTVTATDTSSSSITGTSASVTVSAGGATHFSVVLPASATAGTSFSGTVTALDGFGNKVTSYGGTVHFTSSDGSAVLPANSTLNAGVGTFSFTLKTAGSQTATATDTASSSITGTSGTVTVSPAAATHFAVTLPASATVGAQFNGTVTALDAFNNTATGYAGTLHFTSSDGSAVLPANSTLTAGVKTFGFTLKTVGNQTVTATDTTSSSITGTSGNVTVSSGGATHFSVVLPASATAGTSFSGTVTALDAFGNKVTGYGGTVHFASSDGSAVLPANSTLNAGVGTFSFTLKTAGNQTVTATDTASSSIAGTSGSVTVSPAATTHFAVVLPASASVGLPVSGTVTALDAFGNTVTSYQGPMRFSSSDGAAVLPTNPALVNGTGTFNFTFETTGAQTVSATAVGAIITGTSGSVTVISIGAAQFSVVVPASVIGGATFSGTVIALDNQGNVASAYTGTVHFTSSDGLATLAADAMLANGEGTFSFTLKTPGSQTVTATDSAIQSLTGTSSAITVIALPSTLELYVSDSGNNTISVISSTGVVSPVVTSGLSGPEGLAFGSDGDLYVANSGTGTISEVGFGGAVSTFASGFQNPQGLAFGSGYLYVASGGSGKISKVDSGGAVTTLVSTGLTTPIALAIDGASNVYVTDIGAGVLSRVSPAGGISDFVTGLSFPAGLAFGAGGDLYVAGNSGNSISQITPGGAVSPFITAGLRSPYGLVSDSEGNLYVANEANGTISVITPSANVLTLASGLIRPQFLAIAPPPSHNPPVLAPIADYTINEASLLTISNSATEISFPPLALTYSLGAGAPANATIDPNTGVFQWRPTSEQAPGTNVISVIVADNGTPSLSATQQFTVVVVPVPSEFTLSFGNTNMFVGETNFVPITLTSQLALTSVSVVLQTTSNILTNVALSAVSPEVAGALLQPLGGGMYDISFTLNPPTNPVGARVLANFDFASVPMVHSAIVPLIASQPSALQIDGTAPAQAATGNGQIIIVGLEPVLIASLNSNLTRLLTMYANPGSNYQLGFTASLPPTNWQSAGTVVVTNVPQNLNVDQTTPRIFYRLQ